MSTSGVFSTFGGIYHEYIGRCSVHRGIHDACGGYHKYISGSSVHWGNIMSTLGDIMSTSGFSI